MQAWNWEEVQVTPVALERVVDRRVFRPTMRTSKSSSRSEGAVEIDPAWFGIEGHVNDLPGSRKAERKGKQRQRAMMKTSDAWLGDWPASSTDWAEPTGEKEGTE